MSGVKLLLSPPLAFVRTRASELRRLIETRHLLENQHLLEQWPWARCINYCYLFQVWG